MANLGYSQAVFTRFFREFGVFLRLGRTLREQIDRYTRERTQFVEVDPNSNTDLSVGAYALSGVNYGTNTTETGRIYIRLTGGGPFTVSLYSATGASGLVAQSGATAAGAVATLSEQNSSGLSGTYPIAAGASNTTGDEQYVDVFVDWKKELLNIFPSDGTTDDDAYSRAAFTRLLNTLATLQQQQVAAWRAAFAEWALSAPDNAQARANAFLDASESSLISESRQVDGSGAVSRLRAGILEVLRSAMADNTTVQYIIQRVTAGAAGSFDANNSGAGTVASHTPEQHCPVGTYTFKCVQGLGNGRGGTEEFNGTFKASDTDETFALTGLRIKQSFTGPRGFGPITLVRSTTLTDPGTNIASVESTSGENEQNTDSGVLYISVEGTGPYTFRFYRASTRLDADEVARIENAAASTAGLTAESRNGSGLSIVFTSDSSPSAVASAFTLDLNFFSIQNSSKVPDKFSVAVTETSTGRAARLIADLLQFKLNATTSGSETVDDDQMATANVDFPVYVNEDN